jgi:flagellar assembly factor FliW
VTGNAEAHVAAARDERVAPTIELRSGRFGDFTVPADRIFELDPGLVGFPQARRFVLFDLKPGSPFKWMLSLEEPDLGFAVVEPADLVPGYQAPVAEAVRALSCDVQDLALFVLATIPEQPTELFLNLLAPIVVDLRTRRGRQLVLEDTRLDPAHRVSLDRVAR